MPSYAEEVISTVEFMDFEDFGVDYWGWRIRDLVNGCTMSLSISDMEILTVRWPKILLPMIVQIVRSHGV